VTFTATQAELRFGLITRNPLSADFDAMILTVGQPLSDAHLDLVFDATGLFLENTSYEFLKDLAYIRDPWLTPYLSDLEKEYGVVSDLTLSDTERRSQLAAIVYAPVNSGTREDLEIILNTAGFNVEVKANDPPVSPDLPTVSASELIINGTERDLYINYLAGLADEDGRNFLLWIVNSSTGWPYEIDGFIHTEKNAGSLILYNDYFTQSVWDYSKFRNENIRANDTTFDTDGATFGPTGHILIDYGPRFDVLEGCLAFKGPFSSHTAGERFFSKRNVANLSLEIYLATGPDRIVIEDETAARTINYSLSGSTPDTIMINYKDGSTPTLYADGVLIGSFSGALNMSQYVQNLFVGNDYTFANPMQTPLGLAMYFNRELSGPDALILHNELAAVQAPTVTPPTLTDSQKIVLRNLTTKFKPMSTIILLSIVDNEFTFTNIAGYAGSNPDLGFSSLTEMDGGRFILIGEY
jgi:hypothetical protein